MLRHSLTLFLLLTTGILFAQPQINLEQKASGYSFPVDMAHAGDNRLFIVEKQGVIRILMTDGQTIPTPFLDIRSRVRSTEGERGLLGLAFPPDHAGNGHFYVHYTNQQGNSVIARYTVSAAHVNRADPASEEILLSVPHPYDNHNAGCLQFGPDSMLYVAMGDGGAGGDPGNRAQNPQNLLGKMLRLDVSNPSGYSIPGDNPFVNDANVLDEIWSLGWRNPWKFSFDRQTGDMWIADVGQNAREEVNIEPASTPGLNYGWRCREGLIPYNTNTCGGGYTDPAWEYAHSNNTGKSITGGYVYRGSDYPDLAGYYVVGDYVSGNVWTLFPDTSSDVGSTLQGKLLSNAQLTSFGEDVDGELYVLSKAGTIYQVTSATSSVADEWVNPLQISYFESGDINIQWPDSPNATLVEVYDLNGQLIHYHETNASQYVLRAALPPGIYLMNVRNGRQFVGKIVIRD